MLLSDAKHIAVTLFHLTYLRFSVVLRAQSVPLSIAAVRKVFYLPHKMKYLFISLLVFSAFFFFVGKYYEFDKRCYVSRSQIYPAT